MSGNCIHACLPKYFQQDQIVREKKQNSISSFSSSQKKNRTQKCKTKTKENGQIRKMKKKKGITSFGKSSLVNYKKKNKQVNSFSSSQKKNRTDQFKAKTKQKNFEKWV